MKTMLDTNEAAEYLTARGRRVRAGTLKSWRSRGQGRGPKSVKYESSIFYRIIDLDMYLAGGSDGRNTAAVAGKEASGPSSIVHGIGNGGVETR